MDVSRNVAKSALNRSANWCSLRALNAQRTHSQTWKLVQPQTTCRQITSSLTLRETQQEESVNDDNHPPDQPYATPRSSTSGGVKTFTFRPSPRFKKKRQMTIIKKFDLHAPIEGTNVPIRERMKRIERDVLQGAQTVVEKPLGQSSVGANAGMGMGTDTGRIAEDRDGTSSDTSIPVVEDGSLIDFGSDRSFLLPGDLVEFRTSGNRIELAIFIRQLEQQSQFYTMSGKWLHRQSRKAQFSVPNFVTSKDIEPLLAYLPDKSVPEMEQDQLQKFENALPRGVGRPLVHKMYEFQKKADQVYLAHATELDNIYGRLAKQKKQVRLSLARIAAKLLPDECLIPTPDPAVMYAVYRAMKNVDAGITRISAGNVRSWALYEIAPKNIRDTISVAINVVRLWQRQDPFHRIDSTFGQFIKKAQAAIDSSRKYRNPTAFGQVGPARPNSGPSQKVDANHFTAHDLIFIRFLQCWVGWENFNPDSTLASTGSAILRAVGRYDEYILDRSSGWLLLQELGYIKPWDIPTNYRLRVAGKTYSDSFIHDELAGTKKDASRNRKQEANKILENGQDSMADLRQDWKDLRAYCVDDPSAHEIDDAVSVTRTAKEGVYWIHVHVADPASMIPRNSVLADAACVIMANTYLPDKVTTMLPDEVVQEKLTLAPKRPTLTFSAKLNAEGELLDHRITPGIINEVVYLSPNVAAVVCGHSGESTVEPLLQVGDGKENIASPPGRHMSSVEELEQCDKEDIKLIMSLGAARRKHHLLKGGINISQTNVEVAVKMGLDLTEVESTSILDTKHFLKDPFISLSSKVSLKEADISPLMILAAEVAAKWCKDRHIPIIYRVSQKLPGSDPAIFFKEHILPYHLRGEEPPLSLLQQYLQSVGPVLPSSLPGPHVPLGVSGFSRCTSPLRRYSDLLTHWQIEAALRHEAETGKSLVGSKDNSYLPFTFNDVTTLVLRQHDTDSLTRLVGQRANKEWALQALLRAWKFGEGDVKLPETFKYIVSRVTAFGVYGNLKELGLSAQLPLPEFVDELTDITVGDVYEVKLTSVNPYTGLISVEALRQVEEASAEQTGPVMRYL